MLKRLQLWLARRRLATIALGIDGTRLARRRLVDEHQQNLQELDDEILQREQSAHDARRRLADLENELQQVRSAFVGEARE